MTHTILIGDAREQLATLPERSVQMCVTSPPYFGLRSYLPGEHENKAREIGTEETVEAYVGNLVDVFREVRRVLRDDGTLWLNLGDSYANDGKWGGSSGGKHVTALHGDTGIGRGKRSTGLKPKDLIGIPWRVAFALQADGWYLRSEIIWHKPNAMPESVTDRPTKSHEQVFLLSKSPRYYYDAAAIAEPSTQHEQGTLGNHDGQKMPPETSNGRNGSTLKLAERSNRNKRSVWTVPTSPYAGAHFAVFPPKLIEPCILAGSREGDTVLDPFVGSGTTIQVAEHHGRRAIGIDLNEANRPLIEARVAQRTIWDALSVAD